jgi:outer membrane protein insertion porin family
MKGRTGANGPIQGQPKYLCSRYQPSGLARIVAVVCILLGLLVTSAPCLAAEPAPPAKPKPAQLKISGYGILGNRQLKRILTTLELGGKKPEFFGPDFVEDAALILESRIKQDGYLKPKLSIRLRLADGRQQQVEADQLLENPLPRPLRLTRVEFKVHKGVLYYLESLQFEGLQTLSEKQARSYFEATDILFLPRRSRIYTPERLRRGISSLLDLLDQHGYQDAKAEASQVIADERTGAVRVRITVQQGRQYLVRSVQEEFLYEGATQPAQARTVYPDRPLSRLWQQDFILNLKTNQYHHGYPDATVAISTLASKPEDSRVQVDLLASVKSGPRVWIGAVDFKGEVKTSRGLLARRVRVKRGELLDRIQVEEGRARLAKLGIFDTVDLSYRPENEHLRDVLYEVKEGKTRSLSLLFGWGSYELLRGGVELDEKNIWGLAHTARLRAIQSFKATSGDFTYTIPELVGRDIDLFFNGTGLRREEPTFTRLEYGGGAGLHKYFQPAATDVSARYSYQILSALDFNSVQGVSSAGLTNPAVGSIILDLKHDRLDNPLYPRRGYKVFTTVETGTQYLGGDANYERVEVLPSWHHPLGGGRYLSLAVSHGVNVSFGSPANNLPFNKRFFPGGDNSIRGYQESQASPRNAQGQIVGAETYVLGTVQVEQALTPKWSVIVFSDSLGFAESIAHYPFDTGLFSVGGGIWWRTLIGPVRLEYGYNLNPRPGDPVGTLLFSLGFPF